MALGRRVRDSVHLVEDELTGASDPLFYDVYTHVAELHLADVGLDVQWSDVEISSEDDHWGQTREYFSLPLYRLPVAAMKDLSL